MAPLGAPEELELSAIGRSPEDLEARINASAPQFLGRTKDVLRSEKMIALSKREYFPNFEISAAGIREEPTGIDGYQIMLNVEVPLYFATKQREGVREAVAGRGAALDELQNIRQELLFRIKDEVAKADRADQLVRILRDAIIPQARFTLASAQAGYAVGKVDFLTLLNSLLTLLDNEIEVHSEIVEHEKALARIEGLIGERP
jgi:outer membrane protein TolC